MKKLKIGILTEIINYHSGSRAPLEIAKYLAKLGQEVTVYGFEFMKDKEAVGDLQKSGVKIVAIEKKAVFFLGKLLGAIMLFNILKKNKPDIMTFSGTPPFFFAGKLTGIPIVRIYQGTQFDAYLERKVPGEKLTLWDKFLNIWANIYIYLIDLMSFRLSTGVVAISQYCGWEGEYLYKRRVNAIIYHGTTIMKRLKSSNRYSNSSVKILSVSRITPYKGFHLVIEALKRVKTKKKIIFTIAGSQPKENYLKYLKKISNKKNLFSRIQLKIKLNPTDLQLAKIYQECNIYACADRYLYFGLSLTEAAQCGKPIVTLNFAAAKELVKHRKTGFVAENLDAFTYYLQELINKPELRKKMGKANQKRVAQLFTWEKTALQYSQIFQQVLADQQ